MALMERERDRKETFTTPESPEYFIYTDHCVYGKLHIILMILRKSTLNAMC